MGDFAIIYTLGTVREKISEVRNLSYRGKKERQS